MDVFSGTHKLVILQESGLQDMQDRMITSEQDSKYPSSQFLLAILKYQSMHETIHHHHSKENFNYLTRCDNLDPLEKHVNIRTCVETSNVLPIP